MTGELAAQRDRHGVNIRFHVQDDADADQVVELFHPPGYFSLPPAPRRDIFSAAECAHLTRDCTSWWFSPSSCSLPTMVFRIAWAASKRLFRDLLVIHENTIPCSSPPDFNDAPPCHSKTDTHDGTARSFSNSLTCADLVQRSFAGLLRFKGGTPGGGPGRVRRRRPAPP